ncbi:MAG: hypothetical protein QM753_12870 [Thermomicrobiales bacterium]
MLMQGWPVLLKAWVLGMKANSRSVRDWPGLGQPADRNRRAAQRRQQQDVIGARTGSPPPGHRRGSPPGRAHSRRRTPLWPRRYMRPGQGFDLVFVDRTAPPRGLGLDIGDHARRRSHCPRPSCMAGKSPGMVDLLDRVAKALAECARRPGRPATTSGSAIGAARPAVVKPIRSLPGALPTSWA